MRARSAPASAGIPYRGCRYPASHRRFAVPTGSMAPASRYSHPARAHARQVASNAAKSRGGRRSAGRQSTTRAGPPARSAK